ncbi:catalase [Luteimonas cucumeris]|uniref:Catalase-related peroxidase n=1 Tax=Luteimonas cucumeris TaxID=985012 RepID=A0A562KX24_9GAMM|nr:catalase family peroxidase [Luteimonas cucumeris]TWH99743.1 catalase [Luteimonas cucumeris]
MSMPDPSPEIPSLTQPQRSARWALIALAVAGSVLAFGHVGGWLDRGRLTPQRIVDDLQANAGLHLGYRRNHAKGVCVSGYFDSNGAAAAYSKAALFAPVRTPVSGRFAIPGGNPHAADNSVPIRSFALRFTQADGQQWRTGMNNSPVFAVATPKAFHAQLLANRPDPATGKPDPAKQAAFIAAHPESAPFLAWVKQHRPSASYATETFYGLNAFYFIDRSGRRQAVRWRVVPDHPPAADAAAGKDVLDAEITRRLAQGPLRWRLLVTLAAPGDPTNDATRAWPSGRPEIDAGTVVLQRSQPQDHGECRDINYDPLVLPDGIVASDDPLLPARAAAYAESYRRRTREEALGAMHTREQQP